MSESRSGGGGAVKIILAIGFVLVVIMLVAFGGVFFLIKYNSEQSQKAAELELARQTQLAKTERLADIGSALGETLGEQMAKKLGKHEAQSLRDAAAKLGEKIGEDLAKPGKADELKETLKAAGESLAAEFIKNSDEPDAEEAKPADATKDDS